MEHGPAAVREAGLMKRLSNLGKWLVFRCLSRALNRPVESLVSDRQHQLCTWEVSPILPWIPSAAEDLLRSLQAKSCCSKETKGVGPAPVA